MSQNGLERYYVHGDQVEGKPDEYYCRSCDAFTEESHFHVHYDQANRINNCDKYNQGLKNLKEYLKRAGYRRPNNPPNLFD